MSSLLIRRCVLAATASPAASSARSASSSAGGRRPFPVLRCKPLTSDNLDAGRKKNEDHLELVSVCRAGGGERGIKRHVELNKKVLVRDRIAAVLDEGEELFELGTTAGIGLEYGDVPCAGTVTGIGRVSGAHVVVIASDGTVKGGTSYPITVTKSLRAQAVASELRLPVLCVVDSGGAFLPLQSEIFPDEKHGGRTFRNQAVMSSEGIPQVALVAGLCTAGGAYTPTMSDEAIMVHKIGNIYLGGPPLVKAATGEIVTGEELGGATMHCGTSGIADHFADDEQHSFQIARDVVASLNIEEEEKETEFDPPLADPEQLDVIASLETVGRDECNVLLSAILDGGRFSEFKTTFGAGLIAGFGFLEGRLAGFLVNCGHLTAADGQKGAHFVQMCDQRDVPLVFLQNNRYSDVHGAEDDGVTLKERAKLAQCHSVARVPKVSVNFGGCAGDQLYTMCGPSFGPRFYFFWPGAPMSKSARIGNDGGGEAVKSESAQFWVSRNTGDGVILPGETRSVIGKCLHLSMLNYAGNKSVRGQGRQVVRM